MTKKYCKTTSVRKMGFSHIASCKAQGFMKRSSIKQKGKYIISPKYKRKSDGKKRSFYFNKNNHKKSFDVYIDKNPDDTIPIKYTTIEDVKNTISKLERLFKNRKYSHKRIWQVGMIMYVRLKVLKDKKPKEYALSKKYFKFLKERTKEKTFEERKKLKF
jgi:hypothetical protein